MSKLINETKIQIIERQYGKQKNKLVSEIHYIERSVYVDGEGVYKEVLASEIYFKKTSPLDSFYKWLHTTKSNKNNKIFKRAIKQKKHSIQEQSWQLKKLICKFFRSMKAAYYTLKKRLYALHLGYGAAILSLPANPCPSCETELKQCIKQLHQKGYLTIGSTTPHKTKECCLMTADVKQQVKQVISQKH